MPRQFTYKNLSQLQQDAETRTQARNALAAQMAAMTIAAATEAPIAPGEEVIEGDVFPEDEEQR